MRKKCERPGCIRTTKQSYLMCGTCWHMVPEHVQTEVWRTWNVYRRTATEESMMAYYVARQEAFAAVKDELARRQVRVQVRFDV